MINRALAAACTAADALGRIALRALSILILALTLIASAAAQGNAPTAPAKPDAAQAAPVSAAELQRLVDTLQDEPQRARLVEQLKGLIAAQRGLEAQPEEGPASLLEDVSQRIDAISGEILAAAALVVDAPRLVAWVAQQASDPWARALWLEVALKLSVIFGFALVAEWALRRLLARPRRRLAAGHHDHVVLRAAMALARLALDAVPILAFAAVAYVVMPMTDPRFATARVAMTLIGAYVTARALVALARIAFLPRHGAPVVPGLAEETRGYLYVWCRRFVYWTVYGYAVATGAWWLGVPGSIYAVLLKTTALVLAILAVIFVLQNRAAVADWLRGAPAERPSGWRVLRARLADTWHILAIVYITGIYLVYALRVEGGFVFVLRGTVSTVVLIGLAKLIVNLIRRASQRGFAVGGDLKARFPTLELRANRYLPILTAVAAGLIYAFAVLAILQAWSIESFSWFNSAFGRRLTSGAISTGCVLLIALLVWELFTSAIERYLNGVDASGMPVARSARARTLLPLLRTTVMVVIVVLVSLIILSELGVNIAPLLAGAGVVGLAIGFGSQALVKDVITGLFILIEDSMSVGDVVDLGKGHSGVVEAISIRSIRLRDAAGAVHSIPFSEVTSVSNLTKDFAYFVANVAVSYREDPDRIEAVLRGIGDEMMADAAYRPLILEPLEPLGIDKMSELGMVVQARIKTLPRQQWAVGREFKRRLKQAFDRHGIEMPYVIKPGYLADIEAREQAAEAAARPAQKKMA
jgi:small-conductance mechanosensitive channel